MKHLYIIGGTMGVGKTATSLCLNHCLPNSVFLDGDWCWYMDPFQVTDETKQLVQNNICFLLNSFLHCSAYENIVFCWVLHEQSILDGLFSRLETNGCTVHCVSLVCEERALAARIQRDIDAGIRTADVFPRSMARIRLYDSLQTEKVDVTSRTPKEAAEEILRLFPSI
ncbi:MAG: AAA family ATPase [Eubacteriales bacterium]|nr:AAA family ATPase [Eubacteriales bacterium]